MWSPQAGKLPGSGYVVSCGMTGVHMQGLLCYRTSMHGQVQGLYKWRIEQFKSCLPSLARKKNKASLRSLLLLLRLLLILGTILLIVLLESNSVYQLCYLLGRV